MDLRTFVLFSNKKFGDIANLSQLFIEICTTCFFEIIVNPFISTQHLVSKGHYLTIAAKGNNQIILYIYDVRNDATNYD